MGNETVNVEKIDVGPADVTFGTKYLGRTTGSTTFTYTASYFDVETEEDGVVDQVLSGEEITLEINLAYTDPESLSVIPWANLVTSAGGESKLVIGGAIGTKMSDYADELVIHPRMMGDTDLSKDVKIHNCYPAPQTITLEYAREGTRQAQILFRALKDSAGEYFTIGDPSITAV